jgi:cytoskeletal protein CcmA (bactofilin family)
MFNRKDNQNNQNNQNRNVNLTPSLHNPPPASRNSQVESPKADVPPQELKPVITSDESQGSKLIVGPDIKLKGVEITDCDTLVVEGRVEAAMDSRVIKIAEHGVFSGTVGIDVAEIRGRFEGELTARKHLIIYSTGRVSGTIRYGKITVEEGGELTGDVATITGSSGIHSSKSTTASSASADIMTAYDPFAHKSKSASVKTATGVV